MGGGAAGTSRNDTPRETASATAEDWGGGGVGAVGTGSVAIGGGGGAGTRNDPPRATLPSSSISPGAACDPTDGSVAISAVCDVYQPHLERAAAIARRKGHQPKEIRDFREILADRSIDAVRGHAGAEQVNLLGICQGGAFSLCNGFAAANVARTSASGIAHVPLTRTVPGVLAEKGTFIVASCALRTTSVTTSFG